MIKALVFSLHDAANHWQRKHFILLGEADAGISIRNCDGALLPLIIQNVYFYGSLSIMDISEVFQLVGNDGRRTQQILRTRRLLLFTL